MQTETSGPTARLFYSYSHRDKRYRKKMETALALLRRENLLSDWSDLEILPGRSISSEIRREMEQANIFVFLFSPDFIASDECWKEWKYAAELAAASPGIYRIPTIVRDCPWLDALNCDDVKALPIDGKPIATYLHEDEAWNEVYTGIKAVTEQIRRAFTPRREFINEIQSTEFISQDYIRIEELFEFPYLSRYDVTDISNPVRDNRIKGEDELLEFRRLLIHGQEKTGKTTLARYLFLQVAERGSPVIFVDLSQGFSGSIDTFLKRKYESQFDGDFSLWLTQNNKTLLVDSMTAVPKALEFLQRADPYFERIVVATSSDTYYSYFRDESRLADFEVLQIEPLNREQQEQLIRKRLQLSNQDAQITDGFVDRVESHVNSVVISNKIVPRYPFYILSILQTYEKYMPSNLSVTSYGHCYYMLIVASLIRAGISKAGSEVGACFNFLEQLAYSTYFHRTDNPDELFEIGKFVDQYKEKFFINNGTINRLKHVTYGMINDEGTFRSSYMYYYFLGKYLAGHSSQSKEIIERLCDKSHRDDSFLILLFTIHHARDNTIIDDILIKTLFALEDVPRTTLRRAETDRFTSIIGELPESILSRNSVNEERRRAREKYSELEDRLEEQQDNSDVDYENDHANAVYTILKNNKIMGQVLRNHYGTLEKNQIEEIIGTIADSGLRLVSLAISNQDELTDQIAYISERRPKWSTDRIRRVLELMSFLWTLVNLEMVVDAVNVPEIRQAIDAVVQREEMPAYDLIGFFSLLDSADSLGELERDELKRLWEKHNDMFIRRVLSLRTQAYMNTHRSNVSIEQSVCSIMGVRYSARLVG